MLGVRLDNDLDKQLTRYTRKMGVSKSECAKQALKEYLKGKAIEESHDKRTLKGLEQIDEGHGIPANKVFATLDSWTNEGEI